MEHQDPRLEDGAYVSQPWRYGSANGNSGPIATHNRLEPESRCQSACDKFRRMRGSTLRPLGLTNESFTAALLKEKREAKKNLGKIWERN